MAIRENRLNLRFPNENFVPYRAVNIKSGVNQHGIRLKPENENIDPEYEQSVLLARKNGGLPMELAIAVCHLLVAFAHSQEGFALWFL